ncbi:MAG: tetratricopeptide repeat protein [Abditibacteriota bacterium]|nr:tetratricopeptide repeat protein [Abditibacteriota bacterium]
MKKLAAAVCLLILAAAAWGQASGRAALGYVYSIGVTRTTLSNGVVVGGGEYVICPTIAVYENYDADHGCVNDRPVFLSAFTGKAYECKTVFADKETMLALLKLPEKLPCNMQIGSSKDIGRIGIATVGEMYHMRTLRSRYSATVTGIDRVKKGDEFFPEFVSFKTSYGSLVEVGSVKSIFLTNLSRSDNAPLGSMVTSGKALVGVFNSIYAISDLYKEMNHGRVILSMYALKETEARGMDFDNAATAGDDEQTRLEEFELFDIVFNMLETGSYGSALEILDIITKKAPDSYMAWQLKGRCLYETGSDADAKAAFEKAVELQPDDVLSRIRLAQLLTDEKERTSALEALARKYSDDVRCWNALFDEYYFAGDEKKAAEAARNAFKLSSDNPVVLLNSLKSVALSGRKKEAAAVGEALLQYMPDMVPLLDAMSNIYLDLGEYDKAIDAVSRMLDMDPDNYLIYSYYGEILLAKGEKEDARAYFTTAKEKLPKGVDGAFLDRWLEQCQ